MYLSENKHPKKMRVNEIENIKHILTTLGCKWCPYFTLLRSIVGTWVLREIRIRNNLRGCFKSGAQSCDTLNP